MPASSHTTAEHKGTLTTLDVSDHPADATAGRVSRAPRFRAHGRVPRPWTSKRLLARRIDDDARWLNEQSLDGTHRPRRDWQPVLIQLQQERLLLLRRDQQRATDPERREPARRVHVAVVEAT